MSQKVRRAMRLEAVLEALGVSRSTFYEGVGKGIYPAPCKPDEDGRAAIWWDTEISAVQERADRAPGRQGGAADALNDATGASEREGALGLSVAALSPSKVPAARGDLQPEIWTVQNGNFLVISPAGRRENSHEGVEIFGTADCADLEAG